MSDKEVVPFPLLSVASNVIIRVSAPSVSKSSTRSMLNVDVLPTIVNIPVKLTKSISSTDTPVIVYPTVVSSAIWLVLRVNVIVSPSSAVSTSAARLVYVGTTGVVLVSIIVTSTLSPPLLSASVIVSVPSVDKSSANVKLILEVLFTTIKLPDILPEVKSLAVIPVPVIVYWIGVPFGIFVVVRSTLNVAPSLTVVGEAISEYVGSRDVSLIVIGFDVTLVPLCLMLILQRLL